MRARRNALLIMPSGAQRRALATALGGLGLSVRVTGEPFGAAVALGQAPADLVVLDLGVTRARDRAFVRALKQRAPRARLLLLLPEGGRALALATLKAGADAYVLSPADPDEVALVAQALLGGAAPGADPQALIRLSDEVAHAINNPLQVLSLWAESTPPVTGRGAQASASHPDPAVRETVARIRDVVGLLAAFGRLGPPARETLDLAQILEAALERAVKARRITRKGTPPPMAVEVAADPAQMALALDAALACLSSLAPRSPAACRARVRAAFEAGKTHRLQFLAETVSLPAGEAEGLPALVLMSHSETRLPHPGLALPQAVASLHGGSLVAKQTPRGLLVTFTLPS